jgi:VanZ family protein
VAVAAVLCVVSPDRRFRRKKEKINTIMSLQRISLLWTNRYWAFLAMVFWMAVIFAFSSFPGKEIAGSLPVWYFVERKGAHVFEYAVLTMLAFNYFRLVFRLDSFGRVLTLAMVLALAYGMTDELHQSFVPFRGARFSDVLIDGGGVFFAGLLMFWWWHVKTKNRPKRGGR